MHHAPAPEPNAPRRPTRLGSAHGAYCACRACRDCAGVPPADMGRWAQDHHETDDEVRRGRGRHASPNAPRRPAAPPARGPRTSGRRTAPAAAGCQCPAHGNEFVRWVQSRLNQQDGLRLPIDGFMSPATRSALRTFQARQGLPADGIAGPDTEQALMAGGSGTPAPEPATQDTAAAPESELFERFADGEWDGEVSRSSRDYVMWVQQSLNKLLGQRMGLDGISGTLTRSAVRSFQASKGLSVDGIVGPQTEAALIRAGAGNPPGYTGAAPSTPTGSGASAGVVAALPASGPGFYSYTEPSKRYGQRETIAAVQRIASTWNRAHSSGPRLGIGNISLRGGGLFPPHSSHQTGLNVDIRPVRNDRVEDATSYFDSSYSRSMTQELVNLIRANPVLAVSSILFNDAGVSGVSPYTGHDNHLHISFVNPAG